MATCACITSDCTLLHTHLSEFGAEYEQFQVVAYGSIPPGLSLLVSSDPLRAFESPTKRHGGSDKTNHSISKHALSPRSSLIFSRHYLTTFCRERPLLRSLYALSIVSLAVRKAAKNITRLKPTHALVFPYRLTARSQQPPRHFYLERCLPSQLMEAGMRRQSRTMFLPRAPKPRMRYRLTSDTRITQNGCTHI